MSLDTKDIVQRYLYLFGVWEPSLTAWLSRVLRPGDVLVDVGANVGYYSLLASRLVGRTGGVVAIEVSPAAYAELEHNLSLNAAHNVRPVPCAVAETDRTMPFYEPRPGIHSVTTSVGESVADGPSFRAPASTLPDLLSERELTAARVIKIDVEGGEYAALSGLAPMLDDARADLDIVVEVSEELLAQQSRTVGETTGLLTDLGYHPYRLANSYRPSFYLQPPDAPRRVRTPITGQADLVFSKVDAETL